MDVVLVVEAVVVVTEVMKVEFWNEVPVGATEGANELFPVLFPSMQGK
jgi:hypothetical protein